MWLVRTSMSNIFMWSSVSNTAPSSEHMQQKIISKLIFLKTCCSILIFVQAYFEERGKWKEAQKCSVSCEIFIYNIENSSSEMQKLKYKFFVVLFSLIQLYEHAVLPFLFQFFFVEYWVLKIKLENGISWKSKPKSFDKNSYEKLE